jgi:hypothetical protein
MSKRTPAAGATRPKQTRTKVETVHIVRRPTPAKGPSGGRPVAVIDCGSSSVRAFIAEVDGQEQRILEDLVLPVDLTVGFTKARLDRPAMDQVAQAVAAIMEAARAYKVCLLYTSPSPRDH